MKNRWASPSLFLLSCLAAANLAAAPLQGHISFTGYDTSLASPDPTDTVVFFKPDVPRVANPIDDDVTMTMSQKSFMPHVLAVTVGTVVRFPNADPIVHNAFSPSVPNAFDLGFYDTGTGKSWRFDHEGLVRVYCNVHRDMFGFVLVLSTPYFVKVKPDGSFVLDGLPAAAGELTIWNPRTQVWRQHLATTIGTAPFVVSLNVNFSGTPEHLNKEGKPYVHHHVPGT